MVRDSEMTIEYWEGFCMVRSEGRKVKRPELDYVLLCLIRMHEDASGYQLHAFIQESTGFLYKAHLSQIYPSLKRLNESGLVTFTEVVREGKPDLKLYRVTDAGVAASEEWLLRPFEFEYTRESADRFFMRLVFMGHLPSEEVLRCLDRGIEELSRQRDLHSQKTLETEMSFLTVQDPEVRDRYERIWERELAFFIAEYDLRIECLRKLRARLS